jgi:hypothetical protein
MSTDRATAADGYRTLRCERWTFKLADARVPASQTAEAIVAIALDAAAATAGVPIRRSRHAETWIARPGDVDLFVKILNRRSGIAQLKRLFRGSVADRVAAITAALQRDGFGAPLPMVWGAERGAGREVLVTARARGTLLARLLREGTLAGAAKRSMLRALGAEIARLHLAGYLHGDLTPFNVIVSRDSSEFRFIFLDHERTRRTWMARLVRPRLRNLVQLGHFDLPGITWSGRMRVWCGYARALGAPRRHLLRLIAMIKGRRAKDRRRMLSVSGSIVARSEAGEA